VKIAIIYQDPDVLVVDKPAKLDVYDLEAELKQEYPEIALAHRLDRDTTGVLILAKHPAALAHLRAEFKARRVKKTYRAIVNSSLPAEGGRNTGTINVPIGRHPSDARRRDTGKRAVEPRREAMTHYQILKHLPGYTYLEVRPTTGRTHQIRVHFKHLGHAVANDKLYAPMAPRLSGIHRQALHAYKLKLKLPNGREQEFTAPLPEDFCTALASLGESC
jgi:23S rRNA pseudouridine1911/1915/1917 synthase